MSAVLSRMRAPVALVPVPETIGFAKPQAQTARHRAEILAAVERVLDGPSYILGSEVQRFEEEFAATMGAAYAIGVANGTDALVLAMRALGIGSSDEVIVPAHTAVATIAAIGMTGATPRFVDVLPDRLSLDPAQVARAIGPRTRAIIIVHLYGHPAEMAGLMDVAARAGLPVIEDCAQAHGARWRGETVGTIGAIGCFSCYPTKNLGAIGDAGVCVTDDLELAERIRMLRQYGWQGRQISEIEGMNSRLDELQAAILRVKLPHLDDDNARRREIAARYDAGLAALPLVTPHRGEGCEPVYHLYVVRTRERDALKDWLAAQGILAGLHYPLPAHRHPAYRSAHGEARLPVTEAAACEVLSLPIYPELTDAQVDRVIEAVRDYWRARPV